MAKRTVHSLAFVGGAALLGTLLGTTGTIDSLANAGASQPEYMSADNPWTVGAAGEGAPRWQRQAFVDHSQDGSPGSAHEAFAPRPAAGRSYSGPPLRGCDAARAAGIAPMYRGDPNYSPRMDGDGDGIACEAYRGR